MRKWKKYPKVEASDKILKPESLIHFDARPKKATQA